MLECFGIPELEGHCELCDLLLKKFDFRCVLLLLQLHVVDRSVELLDSFRAFHLLAA